MDQALGGALDSMGVSGGEPASEPDLSTILHFLILPTSFHPPIPLLCLVPPFFPLVNLPPSTDVHRKALASHQCPLRYRLYSSLPKIGLGIEEEKNIPCKHLIFSNKKSFTSVLFLFLMCVCVCALLALAIIWKNPS